MKAFLKILNLPKSKTIWGMVVVGGGLALLNEFVYEVKPSTVTVVMLVAGIVFRSITKGPIKWVR